MRDGVRNQISRGWPDSGDRRDSLLVVPGEPVLWVVHHLGMVLADRVHVVEGIDFVELAGVEDGHEQVAKPCTDPGFVEHGVLPMEDRLFEGPLAGIVIDGGSWLAQKEGERLPMTLQIGDRLAQDTVGLDQTLVELL